MNEREESKKLHRYGIRIPEELFRKIEEDKWRKRKSINQIIMEILEEYYR